MEGGGKSLQFRIYNFRIQNYLKRCLTSELKNECQTESKEKSIIQSSPSMNPICSLRKLKYNFMDYLNEAFLSSAELGLSP